MNHLDRSQKGNSHINQIVEDYLTQTKTDYAVLITGGWGTGKTHYVKNTLMEKVISKVNVPEQDEKEYQSILVSLFGLRSREEVLRKILYKLEEGSKNQFGSLFTLVSDRASKMIKEPKIGVPGFQVTLNIPDPAEFLLMNTKKEELQRTVLILDDLERSQLSIVERLGIVDNFLNMDCKVLLIANEKKFSELIEANVSGNTDVDIEKSPEKSKYKKMKEKVIGRTVAFIPEAEEIFKNLVEDGIKSSQCNEIKKCAEEVIQICLEHREILLLNFRTLKEAIFIYRKIDGCSRLCEEEKDTLKQKDLFVRILLNCLLIKAPVNEKYLCNEKSAQRFHQLMLKRVNAYNKANGEYLSEEEKKDIEYLQEIENIKGRCSLLGYDAITRYIQEGYFNENDISNEVVNFYSDDFSSIDLLRNWQLKAKSDADIESALKDFWKRVEESEVSLDLIKEVAYSLLTLAVKKIGGEDLSKMTQKIIENMRLYTWDNNNYQNFLITDWKGDDYHEIADSLDEIVKAFEAEKSRRSESAANNFLEDYFIKKSLPIDYSSKSFEQKDVKLNKKLIDEILQSISTKNSDDYRRILFFLRRRYTYARYFEANTDQIYLTQLMDSLNKNKRSISEKDTLVKFLSQECINCLEDIHSNILSS